MIVDQAIIVTFTKLIKCIFTTLSRQELVSGVYCSTYRQTLQPLDNNLNK